MRTGWHPVAPGRRGGQNAGMYKPLYLTLCAAAVILLTAYHVLDEAGEHQSARRAGYGFLVAALALTAVWVGRVVSGRPTNPFKSDEPDPPADR